MFKNCFVSLCLFCLLPLTGLAGQPPITLENIWKERVFAPKSVRMGRSMADGERYALIDARSQINIYQYQTGQLLQTVFDSRKAFGKAVNIDQYAFSADEQKILIATETESIYRHSTRARHYIWDIRSEQLTELSVHGKQSLADFSPDGSKIAFVRNNNLFIYDLFDSKEYAITTDGLYNHIINGMTDWVYEEEFSFTKAFFWAPDGKRIAYYRFDESHVKEFNMMMYGTLYPEEYRFKYPKAGEENAFVSIHVYHLESQSTITIDAGSEKDQYIPRIKWTQDPGILSFIRLNRHQNHFELMLADVRSGKASLLYEEKNKYYVDINDDLTFLKNHKGFILSSEQDGYKHLYHYDMKGKLIRQLTRGQWEVQRFYGINEQAGILYYTAFEDHPTRTHLYAVRLNGTRRQKLTQADGTNTPAFSQGFKYFINNHSTANTPPHISIHQANGKLIKVLEDNQPLKQLAQDYGFQQRDFLVIPTSEGEQLNAWILKPQDFDPNKTYPLFMYVYGGPGSQTVVDRWDASNGPWFQMLTQMGYIVVSVDNRGTGARGEEFKKMTYMQLGKYEAIDQIEAARYLGSLDYIDATRIGIFGWSYGGYLSSLCLALGADVFSVAIAVAPVTTWRFYDTIYTERYMRTPQENPEGYDDNSPINHVDKMKGRLLLVHGSADDNVHYQNTMEMIDALVAANVDFDLMIYPNHNHSIVGGNARLHLYRKMTEFLQRNL